MVDLLPETREPARCHAAERLMNTEFPFKMHKDLCKAQVFRKARTHLARTHGEPYRGSVLSASPMEAESAYLSSASAQPARLVAEQEQQSVACSVLAAPGQ